MKKPNQIGRVRDEAFEYLEYVSERPAAGIATDGWTWYFILIVSWFGAEIQLSPTASGSDEENLDRGL